MYSIIQTETLAEIHRLALPGDIKEKATLALQAVNEQDRMFREQSRTDAPLDMGEPSHIEDIGEGPSHTEDIGEEPRQTQDMEETITQASSQRVRRSHRPKQVVTPRKRRWHV